MNKLGKLTMSKLRTYNETWFSPRNKRFFGDISYKILLGKRTKKPFLVRHTSGFSDMFGTGKRYFYRINEINDDYTIGTMYDTDYREMENVKDALRYL